ISTYILGNSSNRVPSVPRSLAYHPIWAFINLVLGCFLNILCCSPMICSQGAGSVADRFLRGWVLSSNHLSFSEFTSSQKDFGSAEWTKTGIPSSPHLFQMGSNRASSMARRFPDTSLSLSPKLLYTLSPTAPFLTSSSNCATAFAAQPTLPTPSKSTLANTANLLG